MKTRSQRTPEPGAFLVMDRAKAAARANGLALIDLSVGSSDLAPPPEALEAIQASLHDPVAHKYCLKSGTMPLLQAAVDWYAQTYGVRLDPCTQALSLIGSQEGLAHLLMAVADPGDSILMLDVAYPSYFGAVQIAGLVPTYIPCDRDTWLPDWSQVSPAAAQRCTCLLLNYPNNPTGVVVGQEFWCEVLQFCEQHDLLLIHDNPYQSQVFEEPGTASSPLALPGAAERCVELFSFAKSHQMGGFRLGFALGQAQALASLEAVKALIDFNQYLGIQRAGIACLQLPQRRVREYAAVWQQRAAALVPVLRRFGWKLPEPKACMYIWAKLPDGLGVDDLEFCQQLVAATGIALSCGRGFGPGGVGYVRFALVQPEAVLHEAAETVGRFAEELRARQMQHASTASAGTAAAAAAAPSEAMGAAVGEQ